MTRSPVIGLFDLSTKPVIIAMTMQANKICKSLVMFWIEVRVNRVDPHPKEQAHQSSPPYHYCFLEKRYNHG